MSVMLFKEAFELTERANKCLKSMKRRRNALIYNFEGHLSEWRNIPDSSWICLLENTKGTEKKVNHYITFYV